MSTVSNAEEFVKGIIRLTYGCEVTCDTHIDPRGMSVEIQAEEAMRGRLIGKKGSSIEVLRSLAAIWGARNQIKLSIFIKPN